MVRPRSRSAERWAERPSANAQISRGRLVGQARTTETQRTFARARSLIFAGPERSVWRERKRMGNFIRALGRLVTRCIVFALFRTTKFTDTK